MMNLAEYRNRNTRLADFLPWVALVGDGVVLNKDGSFQLTAPGGEFFVYVNMDAPGVAQGYWNGWGRGSHAHDPLGTLTRDKADPACWANDTARVCAR